MYPVKISSLLASNKKNFMVKFFTIEFLNQAAPGFLKSLVSVGQEAATHYNGSL